MKNLLDILWLPLAWVVYVLAYPWIVIGDVGGATSPFKVRE